MHRLHKQTRAYKAHYPAHEWQTSSKAELLTFIFFPTSATIACVWSASGDVTPEASSNVNLLNDDTDSATVIVSSFRKIEQGAH